MKTYLELLDEVLTHGVAKTDRTGVGTRSVFGRQVRFNLRQGFPLLTTKKMHWPSIVHELFWFLSGETNIRPLNEKGVTIWDEWADEQGNLGPVYGHQWRHWPAAGGQTIDQIRTVNRQLRSDPDSRRHLISAWNVADLPQMRLFPCHVLCQFYVADGALSCQVYQRSADLFLGVPFNIASYSLLTHLFAASAGLSVGEFVHTFGDLHLYNNHLQQARQQLQRSPRPLPTLSIAPSKSGADIDDITADDIALTGYTPHPAIKAPIAV